MLHDRFGSLYRRVSIYMKQQEDVCLVGIDVFHDDDDPISQQLTIIVDDAVADDDSRVRFDRFEGIEMRMRDRSCL